MKKTVLIIKTGFSETLDKELSMSCSLGDVVRSTVILNYYPPEEYSVHWLTDEKALYLLYNNPRIHQIHLWNLETFVYLKSISFDIIINLEKVPSFCSLASQLRCTHLFGFTLSRHGEVVPLHISKHAYSISQSLDLKKGGYSHWCEVLAEIVGHQWKPTDEYVLTPPTKLFTTEQMENRPTSTPSPKQPIVGINYRTGSKWNNKAVPMTVWHNIGRTLEANGFGVSWQEGKNDIREYISWILSNDIILTSDSLGLHLAIGYKIPFISFFGPTVSSEVYTYGRGECITIQNGCTKQPCLESSCTHDNMCLSFINPEFVLQSVRRRLYGNEI